jgi:hypothetical protein
LLTTFPPHFFAAESAAAAFIKLGEVPNAERKSSNKSEPFKRIFLIHLSDKYNALASETGEVLSPITFMHWSGKVGKLEIASLLERKTFDCVTYFKKQLHNNGMRYIFCYLGQWGQL